MTTFSAIQNKTKDIYIRQHRNYLKDKDLFDRFYKVAVDPKTYDLTKSFFAGATVLDAGCGNSAYFQKAMFDLGVKHITCIDIGDRWIPELKEAMDSLGIPETFYTLRPGSTSLIPFDDDVFDFVASNGVLMHLDGIEESERAFSELSRVTRPGGQLYAYIGVSEPGIVDKYILPALREAYKNEQAFRQYVDDINPNTVKQSLVQYIELMATHDPDMDLKHLIGGIDLITLDTCTFIQNALQVPVQQAAQLGFPWAIKQYQDNGFTQVRRVAEFYWLRKDIRKYLAPVHYDRENPLTKLFYGGGHLKMIGVKGPKSSKTAD